MKLQRQAGDTGVLITNVMLTNDVPIDSCLLAAEIARDTGRALGHRAYIQPVRVRVRGPNGEQGRDLGYSEQPPEDGRYPAHAITIWNNKVALDPTAAQMSKGDVRVPCMVFPLPPGWREGFTIRTPQGVTLEYTPFDDNGDWARGVDGEASRQSLRIARNLAKRIQRG